MYNKCIILLKRKRLLLELTLPEKEYFTKKNEPIGNRMRWGYPIGNMPGVKKNGISR
jgi:hypothetical protein